MKYKKIQNLDQYTKYCDVLEELVMKNYSLKRDEIELIEILIDEYDNRMDEPEEDMNPVELLEYLLKESGKTNAQLARELNTSRQLITEIFRYRRGISRKMVMKLSEHFRMMPMAFSRNYELRIPKKQNLKVPA